MFDDGIEGHEGAGKDLTSRVSPRPSLSSDRREYMSLAAVPRLSRPSLDLQVPAASAAAKIGLALGCGMLGLSGGGVFVPPTFFFWGGSRITFVRNASADEVTLNQLMVPGSDLIADFLRR